MKILISNDDGIFSEGLIALANVLSINNEVVVYAPDGNRSGFSRSMTFYRDITINKVKISDKFTSYALSGTPTDCVKYGISNEKGNIDLVVAGINLGANLSHDVAYSGTVNACLEGNLLGYRAIAFSNTHYENFLFEENCKVISKIFDKLVNISSKEYTINVNFQQTINPDGGGTTGGNSSLKPNENEFIKDPDNVIK